MRRIVMHSGFTIIEAMTAVLVAAVFLAIIFQVFLIQSQLSESTVEYNNADLLAYNNLRTYAYGGAPTWFDCNYSGGNPTPNVLKNTTGAVAGISGTVTQTVTATAPYGCGGESSGIGYPIKVVSTVTYGKDSREVTHATYATY